MNMFVLWIQVQNLISLLCSKRSPVHFFLEVRIVVLFFLSMQTCFKNVVVQTKLPVSALAGSCFLYPSILTDLQRPLPFLPCICSVEGAKCVVL